MKPISIANLMRLTGLPSSTCYRWVDENLIRSEYNVDCTRRLIPPTEIGLAKVGAALHHLGVREPTLRPWLARLRELPEAERADLLGTTVVLQHGRRTWQIYDDLDAVPQGAEPIAVYHLKELA